MILFVLKSIGIVLLYILAFILLILVIALFAPIRYKADALYDKKLHLNAEADWIFRLVVFFYKIDGKNKKSGLKILGLSKAPFFRNKNLSTAKNSNEEIETGKNFNSQNLKTNKEPPVSFTNNNLSFIDNDIKEDSDGEPEEKKGVIQRVKDFIEIKEKEAIVSQAWLTLKRLLKAVIFKEFYAKTIFGFDDPSLTGVLLGAAYMIVTPLGLGEQILFDADFENKRLFADVRVKGYTNLWSILWPLTAFAISKPVWPIIKPHLFKKGVTNERKSKQQS